MKSLIRLSIISIIFTVIITTVGVYAISYENYDYTNSEIESAVLSSDLLIDGYEYKYFYVMKDLNTTYNGVHIISSTQPLYVHETGFDIPESCKVIPLTIYTKTNGVKFYGSRYGGPQTNKSYYGFKLSTLSYQFNKKEVYQRPSQSAEFAFTTKYNGYKFATVKYKQGLSNLIDIVAYKENIQLIKNVNDSYLSPSTTDIYDWHLLSYNDNVNTYKSTFTKVYETVDIELTSYIEFENPVEQYMNFYVNGQSINTLSYDFDEGEFHKEFDFEIGYQIRNNGYTVDSDLPISIHGDVDYFGITQSINYIDDEKLNGVIVGKIRVYKNMSEILTFTINDVSKTISVYGMGVNDDGGFEQDVTDYEDTPLGFLKWIKDSIKNTFVFAFQSIKGAFTATADLSQLWSTIFKDFPKEWVTMGSVSLAVIVLLRILGR